MSKLWVGTDLLLLLCGIKAPSYECLGSISTLLKYKVLDKSLGFLNIKTASVFASPEKPERLVGSIEVALFFSFNKIYEFYLK